VTARVYVNERAVDVPAASPAAAAVRAADPDLGAALDAGRAYLTDGRGVRLAPEAPVSAGAILRVVRSAKPGGPADGDDAHP
jgi:hypothetical protein